MSGAVKSAPVPSGRTIDQHVTMTNEDRTATTGAELIAFVRERFPTGKVVVLLNPGSMQALGLTKMHVNVHLGTGIFTNLKGEELEIR